MIYAENKQPRKGTKKEMGLEPSSSLSFVHFPLGATVRGTINLACVPHHDAAVRTVRICYFVCLLTRQSEGYDVTVAVALDGMLFITHVNIRVILNPF